MMISVKMDSDDILNMLVNRLDFWKADHIEKDLFSEMYQNYLEAGSFDDIELDIKTIVDNDWVNYCEVIHTDDSRYANAYKAYKQGEREIEYYYIEAVDEENEAILLRSM